MDTLTIIENGDTFQICTRCTDWIGTCNCPTEAEPVWTPIPAWQDWRDQYAPEKEIR